MSDLNISNQNYNGHIRFMEERVTFLNNLKTNYNLDKIVEYGFSPALCSKLIFNDITVIEQSNFVVNRGKDKVNSNINYVIGDYVENLEKVIQDNTCYTYFNFKLNDYIQRNEIDKIIENPKIGTQVSNHLKTEPKRESDLIRVKEILFNANLKNSYLVVWEREPYKQSMELYDLSTGTLIDTNESVQ